MNYLIIDPAYAGAEPGTEIPNRVAADPAGVPGWEFPKYYGVNAPSYAQHWMPVFDRVTVIDTETGNTVPTGQFRVYGWVLVDPSAEINGQYPTTIYDFDGNLLGHGMQMAGGQTGWIETTTGVAQAVATVAALAAASYGAAYAAGAIAASGSIASADVATGQAAETSTGTAVEQVATTPIESYTAAIPTSGATPMYDEFGNLIADTSGAAADIPADVTSAADASGASQEVLPDGSLITNSPDGSTILTEPDGTTYATDAAGNTTVYDSTGAVVTDSSQAGFQMPQIIGKDIGGTLANITNLAKQALTASDIWRKLGGQAPKLAQPTTLKNGAVVTMNRNGTVTTRLANGKTTVSVMPVGQPYTFPDGTTVINNGDGTYTTINADGSSGTGKIPKIAGNSGAGVLAVVGIAALALIPG